MESFAVLAMSTPSLVLRYAAAFFFVVVAIAAAYALFKAGKVLDRADTVLADVDENTVPLLKKAGVTLDEVNGSLSNVDQITKDVANTTDKLDKMANAVEGAVSTPVRKASAFSAGVQSAVSSFMRRPGKDGGAADEGPGWSYEPAGAAAATPPPGGATAQGPASDSAAATGATDTAAETAAAAAMEAAAAEAAAKADAAAGTETPPPTTPSEG